MGKLTALAVKAALKEGKPGSLIDGEGLRLAINKAGRAYWALRITIDKKTIERTIGRADAMSLSDARDKARAMRKELKEAGPEAPAPEVAAPVKREIPTFQSAAQTHYDLIKPTFRNAKHSAQFLSTLEAYAYPTFGQKPVDEVDEGDIVNALAAIWTTKRETAQRVRQRIRAVLAAAKGRGWRTASVDWDSINAALPKSKKAVRHMPSMPAVEVPGFYKSLAASASAPAIRAALQFLIVSALRPGNVVAARWAHIDREAKVMAIPGDLMKNGVTFRLPLTDGMLAALDIAEVYRNDRTDLIFPGLDRVTGMSPDTLRMVMRRMAEDEAVPHGFRSSFKNWSLTNGYPDHISELQLAHTDPNEVRRAYARDDLLEARRTMMEAWDSFIRGV